MKEIELYDRAKAYLLSFEPVTEEMLERQIQEWETKKPSSIKDLFKAFLHHAQNRQGMPNSIGEIEELSSILFEFDHIAVVENYGNWEAIFDAIFESEYSPPGRMVKGNKKSHWVVYCKAIASISMFLARYRSLEEFQDFVDGFLTNEQSKLALPLLLSEEIFGFGFALACDFLKENVSPYFIKPDTHINEIAREVGITKSTQSYQIFKDVQLYCSNIGVLPYHVDKVFWLVGSGNFYLSNVRVRSSRQEFLASLRTG
ncbi:MAG: hypothetical protein R3F19_32615 [Verrucomicrobiales bacterium]